MKKRTNQMLKTVALTLAKERAGNIRWKFSYPTSLTAQELKNYKDLTKEIIKDINDKTGIDCGNEINYCPESFASAKHFERSDKYACIDIGGGSTDVSVWKECVGDDNLGNIIQYSIGIASRKIFLAGLTDAILTPKKVNKAHSNRSCNNIQKEIKKRLDRDFGNGSSSYLESCMDEIAQANRLDDAADAIENFSYLVETILQSDDRGIKQLIREDTEIYNKFFQFIVIGFWGILYYFAKSLAYIEKEMKGTTNLEINFAGNGSKIYEWIEDIGDIEYKPLLQKATSSVLNQAISDKDREINISFLYNKKS